MNVSVFGLGYVGAVSLGCLARDGHGVIGVDIDPTKLELLRAGKSPIIEEGIQELIHEGVSSEKIEVTDDTEYAVKKSDLSFICVGTPSLPNGGQSLKAVEHVAASIGKAIATKSDYHVVVMRSTVLPGTVESVVGPILEEHSGKKIGEGFGLCFQPEFLREGSSIKDYYNPPFTVVGSDSERSSNEVREVFSALPGGFFNTDIRTAEMLKYCCNTFHALKITFANEVGRVCQSLDVDSHKVMELVCEDKSLNISKAYMKPGFAFGGSCLPKDLRALINTANRNDVDIPMLRHVLSSNRVHIDHAIDMVLRKKERSVGMIGLSFKSGTDDLRESPLVVMAEQFIGKGLDLKIFDPEVQLSRLVGANRAYIEETIPHIASLMIDDCKRLIDESKIVVVGLQNPSLIEIIRERISENHIVIDLVGLPDRETLPGEYHGACW